MLHLLHLIRLKGWEKAKVKLQEIQTKPYSILKIKMLFQSVTNDSR